MHIIAPFGVHSQRETALILVQFSSFSALLYESAGKSGQIISETDFTNYNSANFGNLTIISRYFCEKPTDFVRNVRFLF